MATNTYGDISPKVAGSSAKRLLKRGQNLFVTERFGHFDPQGKNKTLTRKWRRYNSLAPATTPLAEGVTPDGSAISYTDYTVTLAQYGDWVQITDVIKDTHDDPVLQEMMDVCGEQLADTVELLRIAVLKAGTNVFYAGGVASRADVNSAPTRGDFSKIVRSLKRNKARTISRIIKASPNIATEPVGAAYFAMGHTDLEPDINKMSGFVPVAKYANSDKALPGEVGKIDSVRIILTSLFSPWAAVGVSGTTFLSGGVEVTEAAQCDVYPLIIVAKDAYGIVPLQGENAVKPMVKNPEPVKGDPLAQTGFVAWKIYQATVILNQLWIARLECAATADPE
ncbi:MAG: N4-gp56 family major capsid protein [Lentisphaerae bacterium GWF2_45_14]|nr:MAG: N4-gp56 family major capsid protein [Lentisphaerae bacterium GWF2_45_14]